MSKECTDCGQQLKYDEGSYYCNNKYCGLRGQDVDNDVLADEPTDCGCPPETCKMIEGKCKNLAYR